MKYSIIIPYYKRRMLHNTFVSYAHHYGNRDDYEVLVMEDYKNANNNHDHHTLLNILLTFSDTVDARIIRTDFVDCYAPSRMFNLGVFEATGKYIILTNPECFHLTDVLGGFDKELSRDPNAYIIAATFNASYGGLVAEFDDFKYMQLSWYQHSKHRPRGLHFCSVLSKEIYNSIGGFDEGYAPGFGREDVDFFRTIETKGIAVRMCDDIVVVHMNHPDIPNKYKLWEINKRYYAKKWGAMDTR